MQDDEILAKEDFQKIEISPSGPMVRLLENQVKQPTCKKPNDREY